MSRSSHSSSIFVPAPPRITLDPARQIVRPGDLVRIRCTATGPQPITINWSKEGGYMPRTVIINGGEMMVSRDPRLLPLLHL